MAPLNQNIPPPAQAKGSDPPTDGELVAAVLAGDRERFQPLVERYQGAIFGYLYRLLNQNADAAQDLTQEVFLKAYQALASYDAARPLAPWLYRIAHNEAANRLRAQRRHPEARLEPNGWDRLAADAEDSPEAQNAAAQEREAVRRALGEIKPKYRQALTLYYYEDRAYREIAEIMAVPAATVATLIRRGRRQLAKRLERMGAAPGAG